MKLRLEQLTRHFSKKPAPVYLVHGDEPLLIQEAGDAIRAAVRAQGYGDRECLTVEAGFDWNSLLFAGNSLSLFARRRLLELRLGGAKPGEAGAAALKAYAERPPEDTVLLVTCAKLDAAAQRSSWLAALDRVGVIVQVWPVDGRQLPAWVERRLRGVGLRPTPEAVAWLAERVEGNLLAAAQEIDKLHLLYGEGAVSLEQVVEVIGDSARYSIYDLVDACLEGNAGRTVRILYGLHEEGVEPPLVIWALHRELRLLAQLGFEIGRGTPPETALIRNKVWEKRKPLIRRALQRLSLPTCRDLLQRCARVDRVVKGVEPGSSWDELLNLSLCLAGRELLKGLNNDRWVG